MNCKGWGGRVELSVLRVDCGDRTHLYVQRSGQVRQEHRHVGVVRAMHDLPRAQRPPVEAFRLLSIPCAMSSGGTPQHCSGEFFFSCVNFTSLR